MQIVLVYVNVKSQFIEAFKQATLENAGESVKVNLMLPENRIPTYQAKCCLKSF